MKIAVGFNQHLTVPSERSLVSETCMELFVGAIYHKDPVRQAKADFSLVLLVPVNQHGSGTGDH